ncbi:unnamed protein product [Amoebophrya sp. A120]|nr:unnamed protein product [Amoebophrya sp. A120]|eukprot:GSA120T00022001001.1
MSRSGCRPETRASNINMLVARRSFFARKVLSFDHVPVSSTNLLYLFQLVTSSMLVGLLGDVFLGDIVQPLRNKLEGNLFVLSDDDDVKDWKGSGPSKTRTSLALLQPTHQKSGADEVDLGGRDCSIASGDRSSKNCRGSLFRSSFLSKNRSRKAEKKHKRKNHAGKIILPPVHHQLEDSSGGTSRGRSRFFLFAQAVNLHPQIKQQHSSRRTTSKGSLLEKKRARNLNTRRAPRRAATETLSSSRVSFNEPENEDEVAKFDATSNPEREQLLLLHPPRRATSGALSGEDEEDLVESIGDGATNLELQKKEGSTQTSSGDPSTSKTRRGERTSSSSSSTKAVSDPASTTAKAMLQKEEQQRISSRKMKSETTSKKTSTTEMKVDHYDRAAQKNQNLKKAQVLNLQQENLVAREGTGSRQDINQPDDADSDAEADGNVDEPASTVNPLAQFIAEDTTADEAMKAADEKIAEIKQAAAEATAAPGTDDEPAGIFSDPKVLTIVAGGGIAVVVLLIVLLFSCMGRGSNAPQVGVASAAAGSGVIQSPGSTGSNGDALALSVQAHQYPAKPKAKAKAHSSKPKSKTTKVAAKPKSASHAKPKSAGTASADHAKPKSGDAEAAEKPKTFAEKAAAKKAHPKSK